MCKYKNQHVNRLFAFWAFIKCVWASFQIIIWKLSREKSWKILLYSSEQSASSEVLINEEKFVSYMRKCPIWQFFNMTQSTYVSKSHTEKAQLITEYYKSMSEGNKDIICLICLFFIFIQLCQF